MRSFVGLLACFLLVRMKEIAEGRGDSEIAWKSVVVKKQLCVCVYVCDCVSLCACVSVYVPSVDNKPPQNIELT